MLFGRTDMSEGMRLEIMQDFKSWRDLRTIKVWAVFHKDEK